MKPIAAFLVAFAAAVALEPEATTTEETIFAIEEPQATEIDAAEGNGCAGSCFCKEPICCVDQLDCNCHLPKKCGDSSGAVMEYQSGSRQMNEAYQQ